ncbi:MAG TPA: glycosyltransferase [Candidatus Paceibacterota bacterium]|nr:glycosyltransferase [Candidatus Paceibacterota bacterium]
MIKKVYRKINEKAEEKFPTAYKSLFKNRIFIKYVSAGFVAAFVDLGSLYLFVEYIFYHRYLLAAASAFIFAFVFGAMLQKFWTFQDKNTSGMGFQMVIYIVLAIVNLILNLLIIFALVETLDMWYILAQSISMAILATMNFILYSRFVFKKSLMVPGSVLLAAGIFPPDIGGPATHTLKFMKSFRENGIKTGVITYSDRKIEPEIDDGLDVERVSRKFPRGLRHLIYLAKIFAASLRYETIYAQDISAAGLPAAFVARLVGRRFMVRVGGDLLWERLAEKGKTKRSVINYYNEENYKKRFLYHVGQTVLMSAEKVIVPTDLLANIYRNHYGIVRDNILVLPNPIPAKCETAQLDRKATIGKNILFAGRFIKYKNLDKLIIAFANIYEEIAPAKLILVGDGPEKRDLVRLVKRLNIRNQVIFKAKLPHGNLLEEIRECSVCVAPALTEFNPNFILECLSCGKPVIITKENGLSIKLPERFTWNAMDIKDIENKLTDVVNAGATAGEEISEIIQKTKTTSWDDIIREHLELFKNS